MQLVPLPEGFRSYGGTQPETVASGDGAWFMLVYGRAVGEPSMSSHVLRWVPGDARSTIVPLERPPNGRGSLAQGTAKLWLFAWHENVLTVQEVPGWIPHD
jgi:hypothetical protein